MTAKTRKTRTDAEALQDQISSIITAESDANDQRDKVLLTLHEDPKDEKAIADLAALDDELAGYQSEQGRLGGVLRALLERQAEEHQEDREAEALAARDEIAALVAKRQTATARVEAIIRELGGVLLELETIGEDVSEEMRVVRRFDKAAPGRFETYGGHISGKSEAMGAALAAALASVGLGERGIAGSPWIQISAPGTIPGRKHPGLEDTAKLLGDRLLGTIDLALRIGKR